MNRTIMLIVNQIETNRRLLGNVFLPQFTIAYATNVIEGKDYIESNSQDIAIVLLDISVEKRNDIDFLKWISNGKYCDIPVVAIGSDTSSQLETLKSGAWDFVIKSVETEVLKMRVRNVIKRYGFLKEKDIVAKLNFEKSELENTVLLAQLESIIEHVPGALCIYKATDTMLEPLIHNKAFYETFGYSIEHARSVNSKTEFLNVHPDDLEELKKKTIEAIRTSSSLKHTYRFFNDSKNEYIWIYIQASVIEQLDNVKLCYVSYTDVTEERLSQERLINAQSSIEILKKQTEASLENYHTLINTVPGGIALYEIEGNHILTKYYSDGLCKLSGYTREERETILICPLSSRQVKYLK